MFLIWPFNLFAESTNIKDLLFISEEQTVKPGVVSKALIVQTQNSGGLAEKISETNDVTFYSSSGTGEFLNSSGGALSSTMNKNTSSRTFYYKDSKLGEHTIRVKITGRETGKTFTAEQKILISDTVEAASSNTSEEDEDSSDVSSHSGASSVSEFTSKSGYKVDAGRERMATVNTKIRFEASASLGETNEQHVSFRWSFGDGTYAIGKVASHTYKFPGEYIVVLNSSRGESRATSRTEVTVIDPKITFEEIKEGNSGFVEIKNNSESEINIGGWTLRSGDEMLVLASDTIIKPKHSIKPLFSYTLDNGLNLEYPDGTLALAYESEPHTDLEALAKERSAMLEKLVALKKELAQKQANMPPQKNEPKPDSLETVATKPEVEKTDTEALMQAFNESSKPAETEENGVMRFFKSIFSKQPIN